MKIETGQIVKSKAGHDSLDYYIVMDEKDGILNLVNGKNRTIDNPKRKKMIHVQPTKFVNREVADKINSGTIMNEDIKRAIKLYRQTPEQK